MAKRRDDWKGRGSEARKRGEGLFRADARDLFHGDKTGRTRGGRREFRMDVTAIRTRVCDHAWKVHVPISIQLLSLSLPPRVSPIFLFVCSACIYIYVYSTARESSCSLSVSVGRIVEQQAYMYIPTSEMCHLKLCWLVEWDSNRWRGWKIYVYSDAKLFRQRTTGRKKSSHYNSLKKPLYTEREREDLHTCVSFEEISRGRETV